MNNKVKINNTEISIEEYNRLYASHNPEHPVLLEYKKLYNLLFGSDDIDKKPVGMDELEWRLSEYKKSGGTNPNLFGEIRRRVDQEIPSTGATTLWKNDDPNSENVKKIIQKAEELFNQKKELVELGKQLFEQRQKPPTPKPDQTREERNQEAAELQQHKESAIQEINSALNEEPQINSSELKNSVWQSNIEYSKEKEEVNRYKKEVLADIKVKRAIKKAEKSNDKLAVFKRDAIHDVNIERNDAGLTNEDLDKVNDSWESEIMKADNENKINLIKARVLADIRNRKGKNDQQKKQAEELAKKVGQATREEVDAMENSQLEESMKLFTRWEGESEFKFDEATADKIEKRLMETEPKTYRETIINALTERIHDYGISMNDVDDEIKKVIRGEINDVHQIKVIKDRAIKEIGTQGAKKKWTDLMEQAKTLLAKAKQKVTEQIKKDIKTVQSQIKSFKSGTNTYLTSFYQSDKANVENMEQALSSYSTAEQVKPKGTPWGIIIPVSLAVVALIGVVAVVIARKRKQQRIKK